MRDATKRATGGGNALPTWRYAAVFLPKKAHSSGNPWMRAAIRTVRRGIPVSGKSFVGASFAMPIPSTPSSAHWRLARVGPKSGPPCFFDPPTSVGAIELARAAQPAEPPQPLTPIKSLSTAPTVGDFFFAQSQRKRTKSRCLNATKMNRGLSWGTPRSLAWSTWKVGT